MFTIFFLKTTRFQETEVNQKIIKNSKNRLITLTKFMPTNILAFYIVTEAFTELF